MSKTAKSKSSPGSPAQTMQPEAIPQAGPTHEEIALRAYRIFIERGDAEGTSIEDWLQAEKELVEPS